MMVAGAAVVVAGIGVGGCAKFQEQYKDAPVQDRNNNPATVGTMPDGFDNWAAKCDGPNMVYTVFHNDKAFGAIAVAPNDPRCTGGH